MQKIIFLHITKTAGGSMKEAMKKLKRKVSFCDDSSKVYSVDKDTDLLFGHLVYGVHRDFHDDTKYIAFARHPLTRTISHFYQLVNVDESRIGNKMREFSDINVFFSRGSHWEFENFLCKIISGEVDSGLNDDELYRRALDKIDKDYLFVGAQEFMQLSILRLSHILGEWVKLDTTVNIGRYDAFSVNRDTINTILEKNKADLRLYKEIVLRILNASESIHGIVQK